MKVLMEIYVVERGYVVVDVENEAEAYDAALGVYSGDVSGDIEWTSLDVEANVLRRS